MLWDDEHAQLIDRQSSVQQILVGSIVISNIREKIHGFFSQRYFQLNIEINEEQPSSVRISSIRRELLLDYLQYRSEVGKAFEHRMKTCETIRWHFSDISANDLHGNLLQYPEFSSRIHCRFFPFWPPRDVDLLQWLSHWIKQGIPFILLIVLRIFSNRSSTRGNHEYGSSSTFLENSSSSLLLGASYHLRN